MIADLLNCIDALMSVSPSLAVAIAAEVSAFDPAWTGIQVRMAVVTCGAAIDVPRAVFALHVPRGMGPGVGTTNPITVGVTGDARWVIALSIVATHAGFDVTLCQLGMPSTPAANAERSKAGAKVPRWFERM